MSDINPVTFRNYTIETEIIQKAKQILKANSETAFQHQKEIISQIKNKSVDKISKLFVDNQFKANGAETEEKRKKVSK